MTSAKIDWVERLPWDLDDPDRAAKHPDIQHLTNSEICEHIEHNRTHLEKAKAFTSYRAFLHMRILTYERALELRREYEGGTLND